METAVIGTGSTAASSSATTRTLADMSSEAFFKIMLTELQTQDPLEPVDNAKLVQQISQIRDMEASTKLTNTLTKLTEQQAAMFEQQRFGASAGMIGKYVEGYVTDEGGTPRLVSGVVTGLKFAENGQPLLELSDGSALPESQVTQVTTLDEVNRIANKLIGKRVRGEATDADETRQTVEGLVESLESDEFGLPVLVLDSGVKMKLRDFREVVGEE